MAEVNLDRCAARIDEWVLAAPSVDEVDGVNRDALVEAGMVQYNPDGWDFKLHEKNPDAPKAEFKLMIREADGVDVSPEFYDRFVLPSVLAAHETGHLDDARYVLGYPNAGTRIAAAFIRMADSRFDVQLGQLEQAKVDLGRGKRRLGAITTEHEEGGKTLAIDDTATGGDTKIEGWQRIVDDKLAYAGLVLIVERDPLSSALVREHTGAGVYPSLHWMTLVQHAVKVLDLPSGAVQKELSYPKRLFEWKVANHKTDRLPSVDGIGL